MEISFVFIIINYIKQVETLKQIDETYELEIRSRFMS